MTNSLIFILHLFKQMKKQSMRKIYSQNMYFQKFKEMYLHTSYMTHFCDLKKSGFAPNIKPPSPFIDPTSSPTVTHFPS